MSAGNNVGTSVTHAGWAIDTAVAWWSKLLCTLTGVAMLAMLAVICLDVFGRRAGVPTPGAFEVAESLMALVAFLPLAHVQREAQHVAVTVVTRKLPSRIRAAMDAFGCMIGVILVVLLFWWSLDQALNATAIGEYRIGLTRIPVWPFRWALPIGLSLFAVELVLSAVKHLIHTATGRPIDQEPSEDALVEAA